MSSLMSTSGGCDGIWMKSSSASPDPCQCRVRFSSKADCVDALSFPERSCWVVWSSCDGSSPPSDAYPWRGKARIGRADGLDPSILLVYDKKETYFRLGVCGGLCCECRIKHDSLRARRVLVCRPTIFVDTIFLVCPSSVS